jgi:hypothetical protein
MKLDFLRVFVSRTALGPNPVRTRYKTNFSVFAPKLRLTL